MKIIDEWLQNKNACIEGIVWFKNQKFTDAIDILNALAKEDKFLWANWLIVRMMNRKQYLKYAIFSAEQVLHIFEEKYPDDLRPRKAIETAIKCLENDSQENRKTAYAAANAANAAANAANADASAAACAAANAATNAAAYVSTYVADNAAAYVAAKKEMRIKILEYGIGLLNEKT